jgi:hypothetical protein
VSAHMSVDSRAWTAATVDQAFQWYHTLPAQLLERLTNVVRAHPEDRISELRLSQDDCRKWRDAVEAVAQELEEGRGFCCG